MNRSWLRVVCAVALAVAWWSTSNVRAQDGDDALDRLLGETLGERGEPVRAEFHRDFEDGQVGLVEISERADLRPKLLQVATHGGKKALELEGKFHSCVYYGDRSWRDGVLETRISKVGGSYAGVVVRDKIFIYLQMRGLLRVNQVNGGLLFQSGKEYRGYHDMRVVFVGPVLRVFMDDELLCILRIEPTEGRAGVYAHNGHAYYDHLRISSEVNPLDALLIEPQAPGDALVFEPGADVRLGVKLSNFGGMPQKLHVHARAATWAGAPLGREDGRDVDLGAGGEATVVLGLGAVRAGFHKIALVTRQGGTDVARQDDLPLAVHRREDASAEEPPVIPIAAYSKYFHKLGGLYQNTYAHAIARILRDHHFNSIVEDPSFTAEAADIYRSYGIFLIGRGNRYLDRPACFATLAGDEPKWEGLEDMKSQYAALASSGKPVTTCLVGESMGLGGHGPVAIWRELNPPLRAFRWYGIKKSYYNALHDLKYKGVLPLSSVLRVAEASSDTPWWFIPPSFGVTDHEGYFMNPTPDELRAMMHLAIAYGADGQMLWCLQSWGNWTAMIKQQSIEPEDGKLAAASDVAALVEKHASLLASLEYGGFEVENCDPIHIVAVPRRAKDGRAYVYAVNRDAENERSACLEFPGGDGPVRDLFTDASLDAAATPDGLRSADLTLGPGRAALIDAGTTVRAPIPARAHGGPATLAADLVGAVESAIAEQGVVVKRVSMSDAPCVPGDAIGLSRVDDPRQVWEGNAAAPRVLSWSGHVHERTAQGYLPLASALRVAETAGIPYWTVYPAIARTSPIPGELRSMLHLALANGTQAALVPDTLDAESSAVVDEVVGVVATHGKRIAQLEHGGLDIRCGDARISAFPRQADDGLYVYAVNLDPLDRIAGELMLWGGVWDWTNARDVFAQTDVVVSPVNAEGYLTCRVTLHPGEGKLIHTDAKVKKK